MCQALESAISDALLPIARSLHFLPAAFTTMNFRCFSWSQQRSMPFKESYFELTFSWVVCWEILLACFFELKSAKRETLPPEPISTWRDVQRVVRDRVRQSIRRPHVVTACCCSKIKPNQWCHNSFLYRKAKL